MVTRYKITEDEFRAIAEGQRGMCAVCRRIPKRLVVDHDHETDVVRGLLCDGCNSALGNFGDTIEGLERAIEYLRVSQAKFHIAV